MSVKSASKVIKKSPHRKERRGKLLVLRSPSPPPPKKGRLISHGIRRERREWEWKVGGKKSFEVLHFSPSHLLLLLKDRPNFVFVVGVPTAICVRGGGGETSLPRTPVWKWEDEFFFFWVKWTKNKGKEERIFFLLKKKKERKKLGKVMDVGLIFALF